MSAKKKSPNLVVVSLPRNPRYARRAARPATDKGAPARDVSKASKPAVEAKSKLATSSG